MQSIHIWYKGMSQLYVGVPIGTVPQCCTVLHNESSLLWPMVLGPQTDNGILLVPVVIGERLWGIP